MPNNPTQPMPDKKFSFNPCTLIYTELETGDTFTELELKHFVAPFTKDEIFYLKNGMTRLKKYLLALGGIWWQ